MENLLRLKARVLTIPERDTNTHMKAFFNPASIAVVGASTRKIGNQIIKNLLYGYKGKIYPINPNHQETSFWFPHLRPPPYWKLVPERVSLAS